MFFYRHPENRVYAGELKRGQKGRHLKAGVFIFGGDESNQTKQRDQVRELFKGSKTNVKYFVEPKPAVMQQPRLIPRSISVTEKSKLDR